MQEDKLQRLIEAIKLKTPFDVAKDQNILCPYHNDENPSAYINLTKGVFFCHACKTGKSADQLLQDVTGEPIEVTVGIDLKDIAVKFLISRGLTQLYDVEWGVVEDKEHEDYGYLVLMSDKFEGKVLRSLLPGRTPKYKTYGIKDLFYARRNSTDIVWLTEGLFDSLSLAGNTNNDVCACLGSGNRPDILWKLKNKKVIVAFDNDYAGWKGAREVRKHLREFGGSCIIVNPPGKFNDLNEFLVADPEALQKWVETVEKSLLPGDVSYVTNLFTISEPLAKLETGIPTWDRYLGGGFKEGAHLIAAKPKAGKSSIIHHLAAKAASEDKKVLDITYEIPKRQCWSRVASIYYPYNWTEIENTPNVVDDPSLLVELSENLKITAGWPLELIKVSCHDYDVIFVDYIQRMPGVGDDINKINEAITTLSDLARDHGKIVVIVSSLNRDGYDNDESQGLRGSGMLEYAGQSVTRFRKAEGHSKMSGRVILSTRSEETGSFYMQTDLGRCHFEEVAA